MDKLVTALTVTAVVFLGSTVFAGPGGKPAKSGSKGAGKPRDSAQVFKKLDANGDGKLTIDEFKGKKSEERAKKAFAKLDVNKDGAITQDEFKLPERKPKNS